MAQGKILKHVAQTILGKDFTFPKFANAKGMLDGVMKLIRDGLAAGLTFRVFANYGASISPKAFIQPRSWVPFMEAMGVPVADTLLVQQDNDQMVRITADEPSGGAVSATAVADDEEWD